MKQVIWLVLFMVPRVRLADQWLCAADKYTMLYYDESSKQLQQIDFPI
jgi:hypothetical protein